jgi:hypothetical protein
VLLEAAYWDLYAAYFNLYAQEEVLKRSTYLLEIVKKRWQVAKEGALRGMATFRVPVDCTDIVRRRAERDSVFPGSTRTLDLDCLACGACCKDNEVILEQRDITRFERTGLARLLSPPWSRRKDGKMVLTLRKDKRCHHLHDDNKCGIYAQRPSACSQFPPGSECCLFSREEELGIIDGASS